jgi:hypothetical protein
MPATQQQESLADEWPAMAKQIQETVRYSNAVEAAAAESSTTLEACADAIDAILESSSKIP